MDAIKITLETLYDFLRNEKKREDLQKLEETFFLDVVSYLKEKKMLLAARKDDQQLFAAGEREKLDYELRSIQRILKELYEKREKKIIDIALNKSKTGSDIIDTSSMLREEKEFYQKILTTLDNFRRGILYRVFKGELPELEINTILEERKEQLKKELEEEAREELEKTLPDAQEKAKVRFLHPMPSFVWKDLKGEGLKVYGPFDIGQEVEIFLEVADLLVRKGRAVKI